MHLYSCPDRNRLSLEYGDEFRISCKDRDHCQGSVSIDIPEEKIIKGLDNSLKSDYTIHSLFSD